jgi:PAS domain-containing protein
MEMQTGRNKKSAAAKLNTKAGNNTLSFTREALHSILESVPVNVLFADLNGNIIYANQRSVTTLRSLEKYLPITADEIVGTNYDVFHKNPAHQQKLLSNEKNLPHIVGNLG